RTLSGTDTTPVFHRGTHPYRTGHKTACRSFFHTPVQAVPLGPWLRPALESICLRFPRFLDSVFISCPLCISPEKSIVFSFYCLYFSYFVSKLITFNIFFSYL